MATTPEGKIKRDVKRRLDELSIWHFSPNAGAFGKSGIPDIICCMRGRFIALEIKAPGKRGNTTANQDLRIKEINNAGGIAVVIDDVAQLDGVLV